MADIRFEGVGKRFGDVTVVRQMDLTINDGEFFTFVGPSGCGKSTILNMIAGLEDVSEGRIYFGDLDVSDLSPRERDIAMVFQSYALYPHMSVYENIAFPLRMRKRKRDFIEEEIRRMAGLLGIGDLLQRKPRELSGGQRQRVALGRALIRRPKVFLLDEPLSNLDARLRIEMRSELKRLHQELQITTIYVTHDQAEAMGLSNRVAVLHEGEIQQCASPHEVYTKPANMFVGGFMGSPPMNFMPAAVRKYDPPEVDCNGIVFSPVSDRIPEGVEIVAGIRPEHVIISERPTKGGVEVTVLVVEPAGSFSWVDMKGDGMQIKGAAKESPNLRPGQKASMRFHAEKIVIFDKESGKRI